LQHDTSRPDPHRLTPSTGMQYSLEVSFELARRLSAASHRSASNLDQELNCSSAIFALGWFSDVVKRRDFT
jgi:hypothetical protein